MSLDTKEVILSTAEQLVRRDGAAALALESWWAEATAVDTVDDEAARPAVAIAVLESWWSEASEPVSSPSRVKSPSRPQDGSCAGRGLEGAARRPCRTSRATRKTYETASPARPRPESPATVVASQPEPTPAPHVAQLGGPTVDSLRPEAEVAIANWIAEDEGSPLSAAEISCAQALRTWIGAPTFDALPVDMLVTFIRGYSYRTDWHEACCAYLKQHLVWRREVGCDAVLSSPNRAGAARFLGPRLWARLAEFDAMFPSGVCGCDAHGHVVTCDRLIPTPGIGPSMSAFTDDEFLTMMAMRREVLRAVLGTNACAHEQRTYKAVTIFDVAGLSFLSMMDKRWHARMARIVDFFGWHYPESTHKVVIINAPRIFSALWQVARVFLHPITASKVSVYGTNYQKALSEAGFVPAPGVRLDEHGRLPHTLPTWSEELARLVEAKAASGGVAPTADELTRGVVPQADLDALRRLV